MSAKTTVRASRDAGATDLSDGAWGRARERLRSTLGEHVFGSWFGSLRLEECAGGRARFSVSTRFLKSWIESHYQDKLLSAFAAEQEGVVALEITVRSLSTPASNRPVTRNDRSAPPAACSVSRDRPQPVATVGMASLSQARRADSGPGKAQLGSPLDRRLTFSNFVVGRANQLAFSLARKLSEGRESEAQMTPLFLHAAVGLGKTHLLQAMAQASLARNKSVVYLTAETFIHAHFGCSRILRWRTILRVRKGFR